MSVAIDNAYYSVSYFSSVVHLSTPDLEYCRVFPLHFLVALPSLSPMSLSSSLHAFGGILHQGSDCAAEKQIAVSLGSHKPIAKRYCICHSLKPQDVVMRSDVLATASDILCRVSEYEMHSVQKRLPMRQAGFVYKLLEINIVK